MPTPNLLSASSNLPQVLVAQQLTTSEAVQYTCPANSAVRVSTAVVTNTSNSAVTVSMSLVKSGNAAGPANRILASYSLASHDSLSLNDVLSGALLGPGDFVSAIASAATSVSFVMTGAVSS